MSSSFWTTSEAARPRRPRTPAVKRLHDLYAHLSLWVLQSWLAMFYIGAGYAKLSQPDELLGFLMRWPAEVDKALVLAVGWTEVGLALGLLAPLVSWRLRPVLVFSAVGLAADAAVMAIYHAAQGHGLLALTNVPLLLMAMTVAAGRRARALGVSR